MPILFKFGLLAYKTPAAPYSKKFYHLLSKSNLKTEYKKYPTRPENLHSALSRMYTNQIHGYTVSPLLQQIIVPLLDQLDAQSKKIKKADTIINKDGVLMGFYLGEDKLIEKQVALWFDCHLSHSSVN
jgi:shikimate 5-dehydrogenase